ncbi:helix-turn-helix domain-containing protein [Priestia megaterium]
MTKEVAQRFDISVTTVNKYIKQELLPAFQKEYQGLYWYSFNEEELGFDFALLFSNFPIR